jgi:Flp pilus assembly protein CpaB
MRLRTILLLLLVLIAGAAAVFLFVANRSGTDLLANLRPAPAAQATPAPADAGATAAPSPTATPSTRLLPVVVARARLPVGARLTADMLTVAQRPETNIALQGGYTFAEVSAVVGRIVKVEIPQGEAVLQPMLAVSSTDLAALGSDLALYVDAGKVAVAFPISRFSGAAYAMRPGDLVDVMMTLRTVEIDTEFRTALPNETQRVIESALLAGQAFLFPSTTQGRLEFIPEINQVAEIVPSQSALAGQDFQPGRPIPRRVTQLAIQRATVLWVGTWPGRDESAAPPAADERAAPAPATAARLEQEPDLVILSLPAQEALALKWALERGVQIDLALRAQGDETVFETVSISLPQIVEQGDLRVPEPSDFDLHPRADQVPPPSVPAQPPR